MSAEVDRVRGDDRGSEKVGSFTEGTDVEVAFGSSVRTEDG